MFQIIWISLVYMFLADVVHCQSWLYLSSVGRAVPVQWGTSRPRAYGWWFTDIATRDETLWVNEGISGLQLYEYDSEEGLRRNNIIRTIRQPAGVSCAGTGHVIYNNHLYCNRLNTPNMVKVSLMTLQRASERVLSVAGSNAGFNNQFPFSFNGLNDIIFALDQYPVSSNDIGFYVIYSTNENQGNIVISRISLHDMNPQQTWKTDFPKREAGSAFMMYGILYAVAPHTNPDSIVYIYDTNISQGKRLRPRQIPLPGPYYSLLTQIQYIPRRRQLYVYDNRNLLRYPVTLTSQVPRWHPSFVRTRTTRGTVPPSLTPPPLPLTTSNPTGTFQCECHLSLLANKTTCSEDECLDTEVYPLRPRDFGLDPSRCRDCLQLTRRCPQYCYDTAIDFWGSEGLMKVITFDTPFGPRNQTLGQIFCEIQNRIIPSPGLNVISTHNMRQCEVTFRHHNFDAKLCCMVLDIPVVGKIPIWDSNCNGQIESYEQTMADPVY